MPRDERLAFLRKELIRATRVVAWSDDVAARGQTLAGHLMNDAPVPTDTEHRARELIAEAERTVGIERPPVDEDTLEAHRTRRILLGRRLIAEGRAMRRDSRRYQWRVAQRLAESEAGEN
jgi:hypothetical protein